MSDQFESPADSQPPTPYPEVNVALHELLMRLHTILSAQLRGMYLVGSLALGDFHPQRSDLDLIIVTVGMLAEEQFAGLQDLHRRFDQSASPWANRLDVIYIPQDALQESWPTGGRYPILEWDLGGLALEPLESGWPIQRYTLREYGVVVSGPDPSSLLEPVHPDDLRRASATIVKRWRDQAQTDSEWMDWVSEPANLTFVVLTLCRLLYTLETGSVASKPAAARWGERALRSRWTGLIGRAVTQLRTAADAPEDAVNDALAFLGYTDQRYRQWQSSASGWQTRCDSRDRP
jgi:hypothetical protein